MKFIQCRAAPVLILLLFITGIISAQTVSKEDNLKAAFIYNFTKFIQWPDFDSIDTFHITVLGNSPVINPLKKLEGTKQVKKKDIIVNQISNISELEKAQILFISEQETQYLDAIIEQLKNRKILIVSDSEGMAEKGASVNFVLIGGKLKFELNSTVVENAGFKVSSQLQKLAIVIK